MSALHTADRMAKAVLLPVVSLEASQVRVQRALRSFEEAEKLYDLLAEGDWTKPAFGAADDALVDARWALQDALADLVGVPFNRIGRAFS